MMDQYGVQQLPNTALLEVKSDAFLVKMPDGEEKDLAFDYGFVCLGMRANAPILDALYNTFGHSGDVEIMNIGDSVRARRIIEGTTQRGTALRDMLRSGFSHPRVKAVLPSLNPGETRLVLKKAPR